MGGGGVLVNHFWVHFFILLSVLAVSHSETDCVYSVFVKTGTRKDAGTDSVITLTLYDANGYEIRTKNIETWGGLMGPGHDYFENGNLDIFSGRGKCLSGPVCAMTLTSDGSGNKPGWYVEYVSVTVGGNDLTCSHKTFPVQQWLAVDEPPYSLSFTKDLCNPLPAIGGSEYSSMMTVIRKMNPSGL